MINQFGNIFEGSITDDGKINGFCVTYLGVMQQIEVGWYKNSRKHGNWMCIDTKDMSVNEEGWYHDDKHVDEMRDDDEYMNFTKDDVFVELKLSE